MGHDGSISDYIEENPYQPGAADARLKGYGVPVWALVGYLPVAGSTDKVALDYDLPEAAVLAALEYYAQHRIVPQRAPIEILAEAIDEQLALVVENELFEWVRGRGWRHHPFRP